MNPSLTLIKCQEEEIQSLKREVEELRSEIKDRADTEQSLTNWVDEDGETIESLKKSLAEAVEVIKPFANWNYPEEVWMPHDLISIILQAKRFLGKRG